MFRCLAFTTVTPKALASPNRRSGMQDAGPWGQQWTYVFCLKCSSLHRIIAILGSWILNFNLLSVVRALNYRSIDWAKDWGMALIMKNFPTLLPKHRKEQQPWTVNITAVETEMPGIYGCECWPPVDTLPLRDTAQSREEQMGITMGHKPQELGYKPFMVIECYKMW